MQGEKKAETPEEFTRANMSALCRSPFSESLSALFSLTDLLSVTLCFINSNTSGPGTRRFWGSARQEKQRAFFFTFKEPLSL